MTMSKYVAETGEEGKRNDFVHCEERQNWRYNMAVKNSLM